MLSSSSDFVYVVIHFLFEAREKGEKLYLWGMETEEDGPEMLQAAKGEGLVMMHALLGNPGILYFLPFCR